MPKLDVMPTRSIDAERRYEAAGKRPGVQLALRLSPKMAKALDRERGKTPRATWIKGVIAKALGLARDE